MPSVPIYIRQADWDKWNSIQDKPTFIHNALDVRESYLELNPEERQSLKDKLETIGTANPVMSPASSNDVEPTYAVCVSMTGQKVKGGMTKVGAEKYLEMNNADGDLEVQVEL